jgi:hypothetical protein
MKTIQTLTQDEISEFFGSFEIVEPIAGMCLAASSDGIVRAVQIKSRPLGSDAKFIKFQYYTLISALVDTVAVLAAQQLEIDKDADFIDVGNNLKAKFAIDSYNSSYLQKLPSFKPMHGQDVLLFRAIERESLEGGVSFFDYKSARLQYGVPLVKILCEGDGESIYETNRNELIRLFSSSFSEEMLEKIDLHFGKIHADAEKPEDRHFINSFTHFMHDLPDFVNHCEVATSYHSGKVFTFRCGCGDIHSVDDCEPICDGGSAHFSVLRSPCRTSISKITSKGMFRVNGIDVSQMLTGRETLIDVVCEAVASRKRID